MLKTRSSTTSKQQQHRLPPQLMGSVTRGHRKCATSAVDNKTLQLKKSKTSVREDEPSKGGKKETKPAQKKTKTR